MNTFFKKVIFAAQLMLIALISFSEAQAAGEIDPTFNGGAFIQPGGQAAVVARQPDGKILIGGTFTVVNGFLRNCIVRLNADGSIDQSFNSPPFTGIVETIGFQSNGKIIVGGISLTSPRLNIFRLNVDGSIDNTFTPPSNTISNSSVFDLIVRGDDKILVGGEFFYNVVGGGFRQNLTLLNADGTNDGTFAPSSNTNPVVDVEIQPDGKILGASMGSGGNLFLKRFNSDGSQDAGFTAALTSPGANILSTVKILPDGKILIGGTFTFVNNMSKSGLARLNSDGSLDNTFGVTIDAGGINDIEIGVDGKVLLGGNWNTFNGSPRRAIVRIENDGSLDPTFNYVSTNQVTNAVDILPLPDGKILVVGPKSNDLYRDGAGATRINANGTVDTSFSTLIGTQGYVYDIASQADGKVLVAGDFGAIGNLNQTRFGRFNADGSADTTFNPVLTPTYTVVRAIAVQPDGKILVGGNLFGVVLRLNPDGSRDTTFNVTISTSNVPFDIQVQPDGKVIATGLVAGGSGNDFVYRFNTDGSLDSSFQSVTLNGQGNRVLVQPDGKIYVGGNFSLVNGTPRGRIARLNANGSLDTTFNPIGGANNTVYDLDLQADGNVVIGGDFTSVNGATRNRLARLKPDGTLDAAFAPNVANQVQAVRIQPNGKIIIGGLFRLIGNVQRDRIARLNSDGSLDLSFNIGTGLNGNVFSLALQSDGKILVGGYFSTYNNIARVSVVRLLGDAPLRPQFDFDGDGRADIVVFRPSNGNWYQLRSQNNTFAAVQFGQSGDQIAPADYDGDGKTDIAVFRDVVPGAGNFAYFYILNSADNSFRPVQFGATSDVPVAGDWDADGKADVAVYRDGAQTGGQSNFYYRPSSQPTVNYTTLPLGTTGDKPLVGDFDGDGRLDPAVFRPSNANWFILQSSLNQISQTAFGLSTDIPVPADYDGDGRANIAVFRPSSGTWFTSTSAANNYGAIPFGAAGDLPVPADYDGDGRADVAVYRPTTGAWYLQRSTQGFTGIAFGDVNDKPIPNAFIR